MLLSYENEALFAERNGEDVEHTNPPVTFKIENPVAVLNNSKNPEKAKAFVDFLYTPEGQKAWAEAGFRPVDQTVAQEFASDFPEPQKLYTIDDLGGWGKVNDELFEPETGLGGQDLRRGDELGGSARAPQEAQPGAKRHSAASGPSGSASPRCG